MEWFYTRRRGPEWKRGWKGQTLASISTPPLHLLTIFGIVIVLLWFSQTGDYKDQLRQTAMSFQLFIFLLPILLIMIMVLYSSGGKLHSPVSGPRYGSTQLAGGLPWGIAILVALLLVLLSYQSSFRSMWFGPLRS